MSKPTGGTATPAPPSLPIHTQVGWCVSLSAAATWLALWGHWIVGSTYERFRGRTDLDMPDWFSINMDLTIKVLPLFGLAAVLDLVAAWWYFGWAGRVGWALRVGFPLQWLGSVAVVFQLGQSRVP